MTSGSSAANPAAGESAGVEDPPLLAAYDGSDGARRAIEHAGALLTGRTALVTVVTPPPAEVLLTTGLGSAPHLAEAARELDAAMTEEADQLAGEGTRLGRASGLQATANAVRGEPRVWPTLVRVADEHRAPVVIVGSRGLSGLRSAVLGSVSHGVLDHSARPVLVVPAGGVEPPGDTAVLCYDGSESARRAIDRAGELLGGRPAIALTAWTTAAALAGFSAAALPREVVRDACAQLDEEAQERARQTAAEGAQRARAAGFASAWPLAAPVEANVWATLSGVAAQRAAGVVVVGSRGLSRVGSALIGSVSRGVATHASAPVLVVPPGD